MNRRDQFLRVMLVMVAVFHLVVGVGLNVVSGFVPIMANLYGAHVAQWSPQFLYIMRPLGAFMLVLGLIAAAAAWRPRELRPVVYACALLFTIRALHRLIDGSTITDVFGIPASRNAGNMVFFFGLAAVLVLADLWAQRGRKTAAST
jgi:hypothetical protein